MFKDTHRRRIFILVLSLTVLTGMIVPATGHGNALVSQPNPQITILGAVLSEPFGPGTYDDTNSRFVYSGNWSLQTGVAGVTNGTLHVSKTLGNKVEFQFTGDELRVFFQAAPSLGTIRLTIDSTSLVMNEVSASTQSYEWVIATCCQGTHTVTITHDSGGPVNFDAIVVPPPSPASYITITSDSPDPSETGQSVPVTVSLFDLNSGPIPNASVDITGADTNCQLTTNTYGSGTCAVVFGTAGSWVITATYQGNGYYPSAMDEKNHTVVDRLPPPAPSSFADVPASHPYYQEIQILYANGLTGGCQASPLRFCPDQIMNRGQAAAFTLRARFGQSYVPDPATHLFQDDWSKGLWAEPWAEAMRSNGFSAGCLANPPKYCPWSYIPREQAAIFILKLKYGKDYTPPPATGTLFADMTDASFYATAWVEQAYREGLLPGCVMDPNAGKPRICPKDLVSRGLAAHMIVRAKDLSMP